MMSRRIMLSQSAPVSGCANVDYLMHNINGTSLVDSSDNARSSSGGTNVAFSNSGAQLTGNYYAHWTNQTTGAYTLDMTGYEPWLATEYTIDCWVYIADTTRTYGIFGGPATGADYWGLRQFGTTLFFYTQAGAGLSLGTISASTWTHIALVKNSLAGGSMDLYKNGSLVLSETSPTYYWDNAPADGNAWYIGPWNHNGSWSTKNSGTARVEELRFSNVKRYTGNFTPPTSIYCP